MEGVEYYKNYLSTVHPIRKTAGQKSEARQWLLRELKRSGWKACEETYGKFNGSVNIIAGDPDYIFAVLQASDVNVEKARASLEAALLSNPAWGTLRAVREGRFITLDHKLYNLKPNARWGEAYEGLADILYPN